MQPPFNQPQFNGINPYTLGFNMMQDIKRMCENPTDEDKQWFPYLVDTDWIENVDTAMRNFKDESFIAQYLSPKLIRDLKLFCVTDDDAREALEITAIHNDNGYHDIRQQLSDRYNYGNQEPDIQVVDVDIRGDRSLTLRYTQHNARPLQDNFTEVLKHIHTLWGFPVKLEVMQENGNTKVLALCPEHVTVKPQPDQPATS